MTITLLLDLDDTLLEDEMDAVFIPAYFRALEQALAPLVPAERLRPALQAAAGWMMGNRDPALTLRQVFNRHFLPAIGRRWEEIAPLVERFYEQDYPRLQQLTRPRPGARAFVRWALARGLRLVVATNPLFPLAAQHWRLRWAGLPPEDFPFACISSYETFHFAKPSAWYFAELLARLGWPSGPLLMVGDDWTLDVAPCLEIGLPVFHLIAAGDAGRPQAAEEREGLIGRGSLADLQALLEETPAPEGWQPDWQRPATLVAALAATPAALQAHLAAQPESAWRQSPAPGAWSATEILCHLRDVEREINLPRLRRILTEEDAFIAARETDRWAQERGYAAEDGRRALDDFIAARRETLGLLSALSPQQWARGLRHSIFGRSTLREMVFFIWRHDREHLRQAMENLGLPVA